MDILIEFKEKLAGLYAKSSNYLLPVIKFAFALFSFSCINHTLGYFGLLNNIFIVLLLSLICAIMPWTTITVFSGLLVIGHCFLLGYETAGFAIIVIMLMGILALRFCGKANIALVLMPLAFGAQFPSVIPLIMGLVAGPAAALAVACGTVVYYFIHFVSVQGEALKFTEIADVPAKLQLLVTGVMQNTEMYLAMITCVVILLAVYVIRRSSTNFSWSIAIVAGAVIYILLMCGGSLFMDVSMSLPTVLVSAAGSCVFAFFAKFFLFHVDYRKSQNIQFEDDEYYYYVKAVPKITSAKTKKNGKKRYVPAVERAVDTDNKNTKTTKPLTGTQEMPEVSDQNPEKKEDGFDVDDYKKDQGFEYVDFESKLEDNLKNF
ncbi:MAG: hypothetical protein PHC41_08865 [Lachnospiraceae bacterium]|nr:hypothetical protein [Lachnospiraceae bacterium]MDD3616319.1 hypothetical protein [Lachnospiraceae bacterium]